MPANEKGNHTHGVLLQFTNDLNGQSGLNQLMLSGLNALFCGITRGIRTLSDSLL